MKKILLLLSILLHFICLYGQPLATLVADLSAGPRNTRFGSFAAYNDRLIFVGDTSSKYPSPSQLWITDGTTTGTFSLKYFLFNREPKGFTLINDKIFFVAGDSTNGSELWVTDGTESGTKIVRDIFPGSYDGVAGIPVQGNNKLFFAADDGIHGRELWVSDGTSDGTKMFADVNKATSAGSHPSNLLIADGTLFFTAFSTGDNNQLWAIDLDGQNLRQILSGHYVDELFSSGNNVFFNARQYYGFGYPYFSVRAYNTRSKTVTVLKSDIFYRYDHATLGKKTFFFGGEFTTGYGPEGIWETDGTANGTKLIIRNIRTDCFSSAPYVGLTTYNNSIYFVAADSLYNNKLWKIEGTPPTIHSVASFSSPYVGFAKRMMNVNGYLYFKTWDNLSGRVNLWRSDGTTAGTVMVGVSGTKTPNTYNPCEVVSGPMALVDSTLYFTNAYDSANTGFEIYRITATNPPKDSVQDSLNNISHIHWMAHPSPTGDYLHFDFGFDPTKKYYAFLSSIDGRVNKRIEITAPLSTSTATLSVDVRDLRNGIYIFRFSDDSRSITQKIIIQH